MNIHELANCLLTVCLALSLAGLAAGLTTLLSLAALLGGLAAGGLAALATHHVLTAGLAALALSTTVLALGLAAGLTALATTGLSIRSSRHVGGGIGGGVHAVLHQVLKETTHHAVIAAGVLAAVLAAATHVLTGVGHSICGLAKINARAYDVKKMNSRLGRGACAQKCTFFILIPKQMVFPQSEMR